MPTITISERTGADFAGIASANLRSNAPTTNYLGGSSFEVTEYSVGDSKHQLFVITDNTAISGAVTVSGATFDIRVFDATNATQDFVLHNITAAATAAEATWNNRTTANSWAVAGGFTQGQSDATDVNIVATATALNAAVGTDLTFSSAALDTLLSSLLSGTVSELRFIMARSDGVNDFTFAEFRNTGDATLGPLLTIPYTAGGGGGPTVQAANSSRFNASQRHSFGTRR